MEEWPKIRLGELLKRVVLPVAVEKSAAYRQIGIRSHCKGIFHKSEVTGKQLGNKRVFWVEPGCLVLNIVFAWEQAVAITTETEKGMIASHRFPMYCSRNGKLLPEYAYIHFSSPRGKYDLGIASPGGAGRNKTLGGEEFKRLKIPVPSIEYQKLAIDINSTWDTAIAQAEQLIVAKQNLKKGLMQQLLTRKKRLPGFNENWKVKLLSDIATITMGSSPPSSAYNEEQKGLPLLQGNADIINRVTKPRLWTAVITKTCNINDILLSVRAPVGEVCVSYHHACIGRGMCAIKSKKETSQSYLFQYLLCMESQWIKLSQGSTFTAINSSDVRNLKIQIPDNYEEQERIADLLCTVDKELSLLREVVEILKKQKRGLMQKLLSGKVRVNA